MFGFSKKQIKKEEILDLDVVFNNALSVTLKHEGGYSNNPNDPGGETNYGITIKTAKSHGYQGSMKDIPIDTVREIYSKNYWLCIKCNIIALKSVELATYLFDCSVNIGVKKTAKILQQALNSLNRKDKDLPEDGIIGPATLGCINSMDTKDLSLLLKTVKILRGYHYIHISTLNPKLKEFIRGWINRT